MDEPLLEDVPAGQKAHEELDTRYIPAAQGVAEGAADGIAVGTMGLIIRTRESPPAM